MIGALYSDALRSGEPLQVEYADGRQDVVPVDCWTGDLRPGDESLIDRCEGPTLDIGCGPGRLVEALAARGVPALGIDITPVAVEQTRARGALALERDVFGPVLGSGRWMTALLIDGNIGIGGDPARLCGRLAELVATDGHAIVEVSGPGAGRGPMAVRLRSSNGRGSWFPWAEVGLTDLARLIDPNEFTVAEVWTEEGRWFVCLRRR